MIVLITGNIGSGKTLASTILQEEFGYHEYTFSEPLKKIAIILGFTEQQIYGTQDQKLEK